MEGIEKLVRPMNVIWLRTPTACQSTERNFNVHKNYIDGQMFFFSSDFHYIYFFGWLKIRIKSVIGKTIEEEQQEKKNKMFDKTLFSSIDPNKYHFNFVLSKFHLHDKSNDERIRNRK